jgi:dienelactone hydrolase
MHLPTDTPRSRAWPRATVAMLLVLSLLLAACGDDGDDTAEQTTTTEDAAALAPVYEETGPFVAGTTTLDLDGRTIEVWYPADPGAEAGVDPAIFAIRDLLPEELQSLVPDELNPEYETDAYPDIEASDDGPFPLVVFAHGVAGYPTEYQFLLAHLASWGFVVAAPDFAERGLLAAFTGGTERADETAVMGATIDLLEAESGRSGALLEGGVDTTAVGAMGHSAGVAPAIGAVDADDRTATFIALAGSGSRPGDDPGALPDEPGMVMTGGLDEVAPVVRVRELYDRMYRPKRLVVIDEAGHVAFTDLCEMGKDQGGLVEIARQVGIPVPDDIARLFLDGCSEGFLPPTDAWPAIRHFATAHLRYELGVDDEPVGLGLGVVEAFLPVDVSYQIATTE